MITTKREQGTLLRGKVNAAGFMEGTAYRLVNGKLPRALAHFFEPWTGPDPDEHRIVTLDALRMAADVDAEYQRQQPPPTPPAPLSEDEICRLFRWTPDVFARAKALGFPAPIGQRILDKATGPTFSRTWAVADLERWANELRDVAASTKLR